ncbi:serine proteinase inhibitor [Bifidobacterium goeldii]|uniref:Serine proteinase inhibitor n=1 Tax=Bifidobacterium goeldii TaxID=2306975 RepID=A0A430FND2_9BIFI|nr:serpin family protein [Bifidobacterium goeldii]RSX54324.1 serine proteinase inhibitor [Bifidobacterium goeldii]
MNKRTTTDMQAHPADAARPAGAAQLDSSEHNHHDDVHWLEQQRTQTRHRKHRVIIAVTLIVALVIFSIGGVWWTAGGGRFFAMNLMKPAAQPASEAAREATVSFAYRSAPSFLAPANTQSSDAENNTGTADRNGNVNYSPVSMWMALAILAQGANSSTRAQMNELLGAGSLESGDYRSLLSAVNGHYGGAKSEMDMHNSVWINRDWQLTDAFKSTAKNDFDADIHSLNFADSAAAAKRMESWIAEHTRGMLAPSLNLDDSTMLTVINTVYADGRWQSPFDPESTQDFTFHGTNGDNEVPMMMKTFDTMIWAHDENETWQRVSIPFDNGGALTILLPKAGHFDEIAGNADKLLWAMSTCLSRGEDGSSAGGYACMADSAAGMGVSAESKEVFVRLPRFAIKNTFDPDDVRAALESLGMTDAFDATKADFGAMTERGDGAGNVYLSQIMQGTAIDVNEHGAKASAFTFADAEAGSAQVEDIVEFDVNRPFLYEYDTPDGVPLFIGAVRNL